MVIRVCVCVCTMFIYRAIAPRLHLFVCGGERYHWMSFYIEMVNGCNVMCLSLSDQAAQQDATATALHSEQQMARQYQGMVCVVCVCVCVSLLNTRFVVQLSKPPGAIVHAHLSILSCSELLSQTRVEGLEQNHAIQQQNQQLSAQVD